MPIVGDKNPFYCPDIPAALYLKSLRSRSHRFRRSRRLNLFQSFARALEQSIRTQDSDDGEDSVESNWILGNYYAPPRKRRKYLEDLPSPLTADLESPQRLKSLKPKVYFSDLDGSPKYARSQPSFHDSSFDIEVQHEKLDYFANIIESSPQRPWHHSRAKKPDVKILADRLNSALPGIRLRERLLGLKSLTPEAFMDFMAENGMSLVFATAVGNT